MSILNKIVAVAAFVSLSSVYAAPVKQAAPQAQKQEVKEKGTPTPVVAPVSNATTPSSTSIVK